jgi:TonB family protein
VSGLGQIYNGQRRKGYLFLGVLFMQVQTIIWCTCNRQLLAQLHIGTVQWQTVFYSLGCFTIYAMQDAYRFASVPLKQPINREASLELCEAASVSFLIHYSSFVALILFSVFVLKPVIHLNEATEIKFIPKQPSIRERSHASARAPNASKASGKHKAKPLVTPSSSSSQAHANSQAMPRSLAQPVVKPLPKILPQPMVRTLSTPIAPSLIHVLQKSNSQTLQPVRLPQAYRQAVANPLTHLPDIKPTVNPDSLKTSVSLPQPLKLISSTNMGSLGPKPMFSRSQGAIKMPQPTTSEGPPGSAASVPGPTPVNPNSVSLGQNIAPVLVHSNNRSKSDASETNGTPLPSKSSGAQYPSVAILPQIPGIGTKPGMGMGDSALGNPAKNNDLRAQPSQVAEAADFGLYMAELQRRIRRAWFPSKEYESQRVIVVFKISRNGELSGLRLQKPSGKVEADRAALQAVENAAPFAHLPKGADESVDIQFTFDYNVFSGGRGFFRKF